MLRFKLYRLLSRTTRSQERDTLFVTCRTALCCVQEHSARHVRGSPRVDVVSKAVKHHAAAADVDTLACRVLPFTATMYSLWRMERQLFLVTLFKYRDLHRSAPTPWTWSTVQALQSTYGIELPFSLTLFLLTVGWTAPLEVEHNPLIVHSWAHKLWKYRPEASPSLGDDARDRLGVSSGFMELGDSDDPEPTGGEPAKMLVGVDGLRTGIVKSSSSETATTGSVPSHDAHARLDSQAPGQRSRSTC